MKRLILILFAIFTLFAGCSKYSDADKSSQELLDEGLALMERKKYDQAAQKFENAILNAETPNEAQSAQRMLADAYFMNEAYLDAIAAYEVYYDLYYHESYASYVLNRLGLSYSAISMHPKRDQTYTLKSAEYFEQLEALFPEEFEEYGAEAERQKMYVKLSEHEYQVGRFYMRIGKPESAILRFKYLQDTYPTSPRLEESYVSAVESALRLDDNGAAAAQCLQELTDNYPDNRALRSLTRKVERKLK